MLTNVFKQCLYRKCKFRGVVRHLRLSLESQKGINVVLKLFLWEPKGFYSITVKVYGVSALLVLNGTSFLQR